jgi:hypothetical protein
LSLCASFLSDVIASLSTHSFFFPEILCIAPAVGLLTDKIIKISFASVFFIYVLCTRLLSAFLLLFSSLRFYFFMFCIIFLRFSSSSLSFVSSSSSFSSWLLHHFALNLLCGNQF